MIIYATKETVRRFNLPLIDAAAKQLTAAQMDALSRERGSGLFEWGCKVFDCCGMECVQITHSASRLTIMHFDTNAKEARATIPLALQGYLFDIYGGDRAMRRALNRYFMAASIVVFDLIHDRRLIGALNQVELECALDEERLSEYVENNILQTRKINRDIAERYRAVKINGKSEYIMPKTYFRKMILNHV